MGDEPVTAAEVTPEVRAIMLTEHTRFGGETGAGIMRNRCAFTTRDMGHDWPEAFTYAIVLGWDSSDLGDGADEAMRNQAAKWGWDEELVAFLRDAHERFKTLADRAALGDADGGEGR